MRRFAIVLIAAACLSVLSVGLANAAKWQFHDGLNAFPNNPDRITVYGTIDCVIQEPPLYQGWIQYCETVSGCVPPWCNDYYMKFEWAPNDPGTCGNIDKWKTAVPGGWPYDWVLEPLAYYIDANVPPGGVQLPTIGDATGLVRDIYLVVDLEEYLAHPQPLMAYYDIVNGRHSLLPGYLIGTSPIEFRPWAMEPFYTDPFTGRLYLDGDIWFWPGGPSAIDETSWGAIKALFR